jgi:transketolase
VNASFGPRRAVWRDLSDDGSQPLSATELHAFETLDKAYRSLCAMLFNYAPLSGHPGGSISSGRFVSSLLFDTMTYDLSRPDRDDADVLSYAAGHKALGLYAMWALRNEIARIAAPQILPAVANDQFRLEDLLGFRRNPTTATPLFRALGARPLDGHPTPATPFVRLATGASGVGIGSSLGLALAMADWFGDAAPRVHIVEGEGGLTPGRVAEALAFAGTASLRNAVVHVDWNQSSIDSDRVTREGDQPGDYVQWSPLELFHLHDWNVVYVPDGADFQRVAAAQRLALEFDNEQPTAIVYRTVKGWQYGIEGRASHGAGHKLCSAGYYEAIPIAEVRDVLPRCEGEQLCVGGTIAPMVERCFWDGLLALRRWMETHFDDVALLAGRLASSRERLDGFDRKPRAGAPSIEDVYALAGVATRPRELELQPGTQTTLRAELGRALGFLNKFSGGSVLIAAADLLGSTSISEAGKEFGKGFYHRSQNADSRTLSIGGICEDAMAAVLAGVSTFGRHIGAGASYGAFIAPLSHIAGRLHAIGDQAAWERQRAHAPDAVRKNRPFIVICGHAGLKTGEDGPTHADPQPLQLLQENFPRGSMITLTPWDPAELWPLLSAALAKRPSVIAPFVTRPNEVVLDRDALGLAPASDAVQGVYRLRKARGESAASVILQESAVTYAFVTETLPLLERAGIEVDAWYVASAELFDLLPREERDWILPPQIGERAIGITGFTLATMYRWIRSEQGRVMTMHPFMNDHYPGSGSGRAVLHEAGLDGEAQFRQIVSYVETGAASPAQSSVSG